MAFTEWYVDPSIAANTGTGTSTDPYGDLQYFLDQKTFDTTNGTRVSIVAGTDEILSAALDTATNFFTTGVPTASARFRIQGCTDQATLVAGDGGVGGISGNGSYSLFATTTLDFVDIVDMHLHNSGSAQVVRLDNYCLFHNVEINNTTGTGLKADVGNSIVNCYIHDIGAVGADLSSNNLVKNCLFEHGASNSFTNTIVGTTGNAILDNIFDLNGSSNGFTSYEHNVIIGNSFYSPSGTGKGIKATTTNRRQLCVLNNVFEGFNGTGGVAIDYSSSGSYVFVYGGNSMYLCDTDENAPTTGVVLAASEDLSATPFTSASTGNFIPVDEGSVKQGAVPSLIGDLTSTITRYQWRGAIEPEEPAGGGGSTSWVVGG